MVLRKMAGFSLRLIEIVSLINIGITFNSMIMEHFYAGDRRLQMALYDIRRAAFSPEFGPDEQMVYWRFDPLSEHFVLFDGKCPVGAVTVADYSGFPDVHQMFDLAKMIPEYRDSLRVKQAY